MNHFHAKSVRVLISHIKGDYYLDHHSSVKQILSSTCYYLHLQRSYSTALISPCKSVTFQLLNLITLQSNQHDQNYISYRGQSFQFCTNLKTTKLWFQLTFMHAHFLSEQWQKSLSVLNKRNHRWGFTVINSAPYRQNQSYIH